MALNHNIPLWRFQLIKQIAEPIDGGYEGVFRRFGQFLESMLRVLEVDTQGDTPLADPLLEFTSREVWGLFPDGTGGCSESYISKTRKYPLMQLVFLTQIWM